MRSPLKKRIGRFFLYTALALIILLAAAMWLIPILLKDRIETALKEKISAITEGTYQVKMKDFSVNLFTNSIKATEFSFERDTSLFSQGGNALGMDLYANEIRVSGLNFWKLVFNNTFQLNKIEIKDGWAKFNWDPNRKKQKNIAENKGGLEHIILKKIVLKNVDIDFFNQKKNATIYRGNADIKFNNLKIDKQGLPTVQTLQARFCQSRFYFGNNYFNLDTTFFDYHHAALKIKIVDIKFSDEAQHMMKIFPGNKVKYQFNAKALFINLNNLEQVEALAKNEVTSLSVNQVKMEKPELVFYKDSLNKQVDINSTPKKVFPVFINRLQVNDGTFTLIDKTTNKTRMFCGGIDLDVASLQPSPEDYLMPYRADEIEIQSDSIIYNHANELQVTKIINVSLSTADSLLKCQRLTVKVNVPEAEFFRIKEYQCDLPYIDISDFTLNRIDGDYLLQKKYLHAEEAHVSKFYLCMIRDKNYPYKPGKIVPMPQQQIMDIETPFYIRKIDVSGGKIDYYEIPNNGNPRGSLWIDKVKMNIDNISNDTTVLAYNDTMKITLEGYLYSQGLLQVFANMPVLDPAKRHYVYGRIGQLDPANLNRITMTCAQMKIQKGLINSGEFEFFADDQQSKGQLNLEFEKLKVKILTKDGNRLAGDGIKSLIANLFITRNNPEPGKEPIIGAITFQRDPSRWIMNYWWKSLFSGINNIVMARRAELKALERDFQNLKRSRPDFKQPQSK